MVFFQDFFAYVTLLLVQLSYMYMVFHNTFSVVTVMSFFDQKNIKIYGKNTCSKDLVILPLQTRRFFLGGGGVY